MWTPLMHQCGTYRCITWLRAMQTEVTQFKKTIFFSKTAATDEIQITELELENTPGEQARGSLGTHRNLCTQGWGRLVYFSI